jgi:hypothetical protein
MAGSIVATTSSRKGKGIVRINCAVTCESGAVTAAPIGAAFGRLVAILMDPAAGAGATMAATADVLLTDAATGAPITSDLSIGAAAGAYRPTAAVVDAAGAAITPADTANDVNRDIFVAGPLKLAIANATTTDTALICFVFEEA